MIQENLKQVEANIQAACERANRARSEVTLIAVSKTKPVSLIEEAVQCGQRVFGENKVQEIVNKYETLPKDLQWHMIGHLQRNKVKQIIDKTALIHSVDSLRLAETIDKEAQKKGLRIPILVEVNVANEASKFGVSTKELIPFLEELSSYKGLLVSGLMTIAPYTSNPEENRPIFRELKQLSVDITAKNINNINVEILSMGMTGDYQVAIEEGATMVRVGTGIFGEREYPTTIQIGD